MATSRATVNSPHLSRQIVGLAIVSASLGAGLVASIARNPPPLPQGWVLLAIGLAAMAACAWMLRYYLLSEWCVEVLGGQVLVCNWWDRLRGKAGQRFELSEINRIVRRRPSYVDIQTVRGDITLTIPWWGRAQHRELDRLVGRYELEMSEPTQSHEPWIQR